MYQPRGLRPRLIVAALLFWSVALPAHPDKPDKIDKTDDNDKAPKRPALFLKAVPRLSFSPSRVFFTAELRGGPNDYEEYYCPTVQWDWGDGTESESTLDCEPYEAGKTEIRRRFTADHIYRASGNHRVQIRLKRKEKVLTGASIPVTVRPGLRDSSSFGS